MALVNACAGRWNVRQAEATGPIPGAASQSFGQEIVDHLGFLPREEDGLPQLGEGSRLLSSDLEDFDGGRIARVDLDGYRDPVAKNGIDAEEPAQTKGLCQCLADAFKGVP